MGWGGYGKLTSARLLFVIKKKKKKKTIQTSLFIPFLKGGELAITVSKTYSFGGVLLGEDGEHTTSGT